MAKPKLKECGCPEAKPDRLTKDLTLTFNGMRRGVPLGWAYQCSSCLKWSVRITGAFIRKEKREFSHE